MNKIIVCKNISLIVGNKYIQQGLMSNKLYQSFNYYGQGIALLRNLTIQPLEAIGRVGEYVEELAQSNKVFYYDYNQ